MQGVNATEFEDRGLKAPFPWFGGKSRAASLIWDRLGNVDTYNEPFAGSLAVLLSRPHEPRVETVNDIDAYLANFWRALQADPEQVAYYADYPVNETDLHARHLWLVKQDEFRASMKADPEFYDAKIAGRESWSSQQADVWRRQRARRGRASRRHRAAWRTGSEAAEVTRGRLGRRRWR
jgi:hypothetical protein